MGVPPGKGEEWGVMILPGNERVPVVRDFHC